MDLKEEVINYLKKKETIALSTSSTDGHPLTHAVAVVSENGIVYFATNRNTRKVRNIQANPNVAYSTWDMNGNLEKIKQVQMEGKAIILTDEKEIEEADQKLMKKFHELAKHKKVTRNPDNIFIKIEPIKCYYSDYSKGFGHRDIVIF